jgi:hypothetical protein
VAAHRRVALACGLALFLLTASAWAQNADPPPTSSFRVAWHEQTGAPVPLLEGQVSNLSAAWVTDVRLRVEGVNRAGDPVGVKFTWALGDILPGGETAFIVWSMPDAVDYRISVASFDVVSLSQPPSP